jgi:hypothetical protein
VSGVRIELYGGPQDGLLLVLPGDPVFPPYEFLVAIPPSVNDFLQAEVGEPLPLRRGVYRRAEALSAAGADWAYQWVGERP